MLFSPSRRITGLLLCRNISQLHIDKFRSLIGRGCVLTEDIHKYQTDWLQSYSGGSVVCAPKCTEDVSALIRYCHTNSISIVPQGGNTGLVGGSVARSDDEVILSLINMNRILELDEDASVLVCEAGCVLENLENFASSRGYTVPLDMGSKGSCMIGGNISTNAGGLRVLRYGSLHHNVLGLEVVLPDGQVLDLLSKLRKDNTGYHLKHLFIGAEGTLGVITKACIQLVARPTSVHVLLFRVRSFQEVKELLRAARRSLSEILSAFEFMDERCIAAVEETSPVVVTPITTNFGLNKGATETSEADATNAHPHSLFVLIETSGFHFNSDMNRLEQFVASVTNDTTTNNRGSSSSNSTTKIEKEATPAATATATATADIILSQNDAQRRALWSIRETVPVSLAQLARPRPVTVTSTITAGTATGTGTGTDFVDTEIGREPLLITDVGKLFKYDVSLSLDGMVELVRGTAVALRQRGYRVVYQEFQQAMTNDASDAGNATDAGDDIIYGKRSNSSGCSSSGGSEIGETIKVSSPIVLEIFSFGHMGDNNLHLNILMRCQHVTLTTVTDGSTENNSTITRKISGDRDCISDGDSDCGKDILIKCIQRDIDDVVFSLVARTSTSTSSSGQKVSISAEHGIGQKNLHHLEAVKTELELSVMRQIKRSLDKKLIMNPGKVISATGADTSNSTIL